MNCCAALGLVDGEDRLELLDVDARSPSSPRASASRDLGGDDDDRLPDERDLVLGEQQLVLDDRAEAVVTRGRDA